MAQFIELYIDQYTDYNTVINLTDNRTNDYINVSGYIVTSQMRRSYYSSNASANLTCTIIDAQNGSVQIGLTAGQTANIKPGRYYFDVLSTNRSNTTSRVLEGIITITPGVTR